MREKNKEDKNETKIEQVNNVSQSNFFRTRRDHFSLDTDKKRKEKNNGEK